LFQGQARPICISGDDPWLKIVAQTPSLNDFAAANLDFGAGFGFVRPASGRACVFSPPDFRRPLWAAP